MMSLHLCEKLVTRCLFLRFVFGGHHSALSCTIALYDNGSLTDDGGDDLWPSQEQLSFVSSENAHG